MSTEYQLSPEDIEIAEIMGKSHAEYKAMKDAKVLAKGTYRGIIVKAEVKVVANPGKKTDGALQLGLQIAPVTSEGLPVKRYGTPWANLNLPIVTGDYAPSDKALSFSLDQLRNLAESVKISVATLLRSFKNKEVPTGLVGSTITFSYDTQVSPTDPTKTFSDVKFVRGSSKLSPMAADQASGTSGGAPAASVAADIAF